MSTSETTRASQEIRLQQQIAALENEFLVLAGSNDPDRHALWSRLAWLYSAVGEQTESTKCWANALWQTDLPPVRWTWQWAKAELGLNKAEFEADRLDHLIRQTQKGGAANRGRALASYVLWATQHDPPPTVLTTRSDEIARCLEKHEADLPLKLAWLVWKCLSGIVDSGTLAAARERLTHGMALGGLLIHRDIPRFLVKNIGAARQAVRTDWLLHLHQLALAWAKDETDAKTAQTRAYISFVFAYGLARAGSAEHARQLWEESQAAIDLEDTVHRFAAEAFAHRIRQANAGERLAGILPTNLTDKCSRERLEQYFVERLRKHLRILEPDQIINPYRDWTGRSSGLERELQEFTELPSSEIPSRTRRLWEEYPSDHFRIMETALNVARRTDDAFADELLSKSIGMLQSGPSDESMTQTWVQCLGSTVEVAGRFQRVDSVEQSVQLFKRWFENLQLDDTSIQHVELLLGRVLSGMRRIGLLNEVEILLRRITAKLLDGEDPANLDEERSTPVQLQCLLSVASFWLHLRRETQAHRIFEVAKRRLESGNLKNRDHTRLLCVYASSLSSAPMETKQHAFEQLFKRTVTAKDTYTTSSHFSSSKLDVVEAVVLSLVGDGSEAENAVLLEEEEAIVLRRIEMDAVYGDIA